jgi:hypothetical protein
VLRQDADGAHEVRVEPACHLHGTGPLTWRL